METKRNYNSIDLVKFIMAFAVIAIHTGLKDAFSTDTTKQITDQIINLGVPFFFLSSGYLIASKMETPCNSENNIRMLKNYLVKILKLYLVWMTIYLPMTVFVYFRDHVLPLRAFLLIIKGYVLTGEQYNAWHFWYLLSTIVTVVVIIIMTRMKVKPEGLMILSVIGFICTYILHKVPELGGSLPFVLRAVRKILEYNLINNRVFYGFVYIPIGMCIFRHKIPVIINWIMMIGGFAANIFINGVGADIFLAIVPAVGLFGIVETIRLSDKKVFPFLRRMSTYIYLVHMYMWTFFYVFFLGGEAYGLIPFVFTSILSVLVALIIVGVKGCLRKRTDK